MKVSTLYKKHLDNGLVHELGFSFLGIIIGALLGAGYGVLNVLYLEQTESGRYAVYNACVDAVSYQDERGTSYNCTKETAVTVPLGERVGERAKHYSILGGMFGFFPGLALASFILNKRKKKQEKSDNWVENFIRDY